MPDQQEHICKLAEKAATAPEPDTALRTLRDLREALDAFERRRVEEALRSGESFGRVAKAIGISRQSAHRRYRDLAPADPDPVALSSQARQAVVLAREEAAATQANCLGSDHMLLGVLRSGGDASRALEAEGVTVAATRACVANGNRVHRDDDRVAPRVLADAADIARARLASCVEAEHLVLATLNADDGGALRAIAALGVTPAAVRDRLGC